MYIDKTKQVGLSDFFKDSLAEAKFSITDYGQITFKAPEIF